MQASLAHKTVRFVRLLWVDAGGVRRCRVVPRKRLEDAAAHGVGLAFACFWLPAWGDACITDDPAGVPVGEMRLVPDATATHTLPWMPSHAISLVTMCKQPPDEPWGCCPRTALRRVLGRAQERHGLTLQLGFELEFYLFHKPEKGEVGGSTGRGGVPPPLDGSNYCSASALDAAAPVLSEMVTTLASFGISVDQLHPESGPGQFEISLAHAPAAQAVDALLFAQQAVAAVAAKHSLLASFLPKPLAGAAASGMHMHFSLWQGESNLLEHDPPRPKRPSLAPNPLPMPYLWQAFVFAGVEEPSVPGLAPTGEAFLAGVLHHLPALMAFTAPSPNSYRRLEPHAWAGAFQCYGVNNREAPLRLCSTPGVAHSFNCEYKMMDGTANPHLAAAALIVAGLRGIEQSMKLPQPCTTDPGSLSEGALAGAGIARLPQTLGEAIEAFQADEDLHAALVDACGSKTLPRAFMATRRSESQHLKDKSLEEEAALLYARY
ncbi:hypothetical protein ABPG75_010275 [Micractinium tetrahymenae]